MNEQKMRIAWVVAGAYFVIIVECMTMGVISYSLAEQILQLAATAWQARNAPSVIVITFVSVCFVGWLFSIPALCYGIQTHHDTSLIPYLVWRMLFNVIIVGSVAALAHGNKTKWYQPLFGNPFRKTFHDQELFVAIGEVVIGTLCFFIIKRAFSEFSVHRLQYTNSFRRD